MSIMDSLPADQAEADRLLREWLEPQQREHEASFPGLETFQADYVAGLEYQLQRGFGSSGAVDVVGDVKKWPSIRAKLENGRIDHWSQCPDLLRVRVLVPVERDVPRVVSALREIRLGGVDTKKWWRSTGPGRGYAATHFQGFIDPSDERLPSLTAPVGVEIQIQTRLQDAWSHLAHSFYKAREPETVVVRTAVYRLAAALELMDQEIVRISEWRSVERDSVERRVREGEYLGVEIDEVSLIHVSSLQLRERFERLRHYGTQLGLRESAWQETVRPGDEVDDFLDVAERHGVVTLGDLESLVDEVLNPSESVLRSKLQAFTLREMERSASANPDRPLFEYRLMNRPLFLLALAISFRSPAKGVVRLRSASLPNFWSVALEGT